MWWSHRAGGRGPYEDGYKGGAKPGVTVDALGMAHILRTEALTATCLLIIAACALGFMLFNLREILIPFAIAVFLMYLLQPLVNYLSKPPRRWCDKCVKRRGEICCEGMFRVTKSRTYSALDDSDVSKPRSSRAGSRAGTGQQGEASMGIGTERWTACLCLNKSIIPRWMAVIFASEWPQCASPYISRVGEVIVGRNGLIMGCNYEFCIWVLCALRLLSNLCYRKAHSKLLITLPIDSVVCSVLYTI
ncbi:unnamed protein product [Choristocarpus tenellus]